MSKNGIPQGLSWNDWCDNIYATRYTFGLFFMRQGTGCGEVFHTPMSLRVSRTLVGDLEEGFHDSTEKGLLLMTLDTDPYFLSNF